jgi:hypothetical protein
LRHFAFCCCRRVAVAIIAITAAIAVVAATVVAVNVVVAAVSVATVIITVIVIHSAIIITVAGGVLFLLAVPVYLLNVSAEMSQSAKGSAAAIGRTLVPLSPRATLNGLFRKNEFNVCMTAISAMVNSVPNIQCSMTECYLRHFPTGLVFLLERVRAVMSRELVGSTEPFSATAVLTLVRFFTGMDSRVSC